MRTRIKICGITRPEDALAAASLGADAIGLVFYGPSPRYLAVDAIDSVLAGLPAFVTVTALFVDPDESLVRKVMDSGKIDLLQFHGHEDEVFCKQFGMRYLKAIRMRPELDLDSAINSYGSASGILLDTYKEGVAGGTGDTFNWNRVSAGLQKPVVLAGGLTADNVAQAISTVHPYAVDVSGGVEASKGIKDHELIKRFINEVHHVDQQ